MMRPRRQEIVALVAHRLKSLRHSVWLFPVVLAFIVVGLTAAKVNGSSIGIYHQVIYGKEKPDPSLIYGKPQPIRSDEWLVVTQLTIAQSEADYPRINQNLGNGKDMSLVGDVPYKEWSAIFKPQNLAFLVLPLEYAFALKWWLLLYLLIVSCYFFTLRILNDKRLFAVLFSLAIGFTPFVFWWYQTTTLAPLFYGFFIMLVGIRIIRREPARFLKARPQVYSDALYVLVLSYLAVALALVLYPPFQIPIAIVVSAFLLGYILQVKSAQKKSLRSTLRSIMPMALSLVLAGIVLAIFVSTRSDAIEAINNTVYPGQRTVYSGRFNPIHFFDSFLMPQLQTKNNGVHFFTNQSEASNFILLMPFLLLPGFALMFYEYKKRRQIDWLFLIIQLTCLVFLARLFLPVGQLPYKLFLLDKVPLDRLLIGVGFVGILQTLYIFLKIQIIQLPRKVLGVAAITYGLACFIVLLWVGSYTIEHYPRFISSWATIITLAGFFCSIIVLILLKRQILAAGLFVVFSFISINHIHPLYKGLGVIADNKVLADIQRLSPPNATWVAVDNIYFENFPVISNRDSLTGIQVYPDISFWRQLQGPQSDYIYNRYAHVTFNSNPALPQKLRLVQTDHFQIKFSCDEFVLENVDFVLSPSPLSTSCTSLIDTIKFPVLNFYIYKVNIP